MEQIEKLEKKLATLSGAGRVDSLIELAGLTLNSDTSKSGQYAHEAFALARRINYLAGEAESLKKLGLVYYITCEWEKLSEAYERAIAILTQLARPAEIAYCYSQLAGGYDRSGDAEKAMSCYLEAMKIWEQLNQEQYLANVYHDLGIRYLRQNNLQEALEYLLLELKIWQKLKADIKISNTLSNLGVAYRRLGQDDKALDCYLRSIAIGEKDNNFHGISGSYGNIGAMHLERQRYDEAIHYFEKALAIQQNLNDRMNTLITRINLGKSYFFRQDYDRSEDYYQQALADARALKSTHMELHCLLDMTAVYENQKKYLEAIKLYREYIDLRDQYESDEQHRQLLELQTKLDNEKNRLEAKFHREKSEKMQKELDIAGEIQANLFPEKQPNVTGLDIAGLCQPAREVGGDYFDFVFSPNQQQFFIAIADVTGKGVSACLLAIELRTLLHSAINSHLPLKEIVTRANHFIYNDTRRLGQPMMISMLLMCWEPATARMTYINASHDPFLIYQAQKETVESSPVCGMWLGVEPDISGYISVEELQLQPDDAVLLYTDGVTEYRQKNQEEFNLDRLIEFFANCHPRDSQGIIAALLASLNQFGPATEQHDDITVIALRCR